ncbi:MAG: SurA N-terminal domain-containing protein [Candidatus Cybelea sp.]
MRVSSIFGCAFLFGTLVAGCSSGRDPVVTVNGQPISKSQLDARLENQPKAQDMLLRLVSDTVIEQYAQKNKIIVTDAEADAQARLVKANFPGHAWSQMLAIRNLSESEVRPFFREQMILNKAVAPDVNVTAAQVAAYFVAHRASFGRSATLASAAPAITERLQEQQAGPDATALADKLISVADVKIYDPRFAKLLEIPSVSGASSPRPLK